MAVVLKADSRTLTDNVEYTFLLDNHASGASSITVVNTSGISADDFILIDEVGKETSELFRVGSVNSSTGVITLEDSSGSAATTRYAHSESTKVYRLFYNQIRFFHTSLSGNTITDESPSFDAQNPLTGWQAVDPTNWYTTYTDEDNTSGFGWFLFRNSISDLTSAESNPIPYAGFAGNTVAQVFEDFDSLLNVDELKLVTTQEKFSWLNEALALLKNKLNLSNVEYFVSEEKSLSITSGTSEYLLDSDFSDLVYIHDGTDLKVPIPFLDVKKAGTYAGSRTHYYLRGRYIGFVPEPDEDTTYKYKYRGKATTVSNLSTYIDLPDNAFYALKDFMMYRASQKFKNPMATQYYQAFTNSVEHFVQASVQRNSELDSWDIAPWANV